MLAAKIRNILHEEFPRSNRRHEAILRKFTFNVWVTKIVLIGVDTI